MLLAEAQLQRCRIDDVVGAIPVHLAAGIWGTVAVALFGDLDLLGTGLSREAQLGVQLVGILTAGLWAFGLTFFLLWLTNRRWPLRVRHRDEHIGLNVAEHGAASDLVDFFLPSCGGKNALATYAYGLQSNPLPPSAKSLLATIG